MHAELERLKRDVRRNEAIIEYMELRGAFTPSMRSIGDIAKHNVAKEEATGGQHEQHEQHDAREGLPL